MTTPSTPHAGPGVALSPAAKGYVLSTVPILASLNLDESIAFYTERLGFVLMAQLADYVIVGRDRKSVG